MAPQPAQVETMMSGFAALGRRTKRSLLMEISDGECADIVRQHSP